MTFEDQNITIEKMKYYLQLSLRVDQTEFRIIGIKNERSGEAVLKRVMIEFFDPSENSKRC